MRYAGRTERDEEGPWFTIGQLEVTTTIAVVLLWVIALVVWTIEGPAHTLTGYTALYPAKILSGEVWRLVTWPAFVIEFRLREILALAIFWYFGTELERMTGRVSFARLLGWSVLVIGVAGTVLGELFGQGILADIGLLELMVVLLFCAEHPTRPFFFNIPAWAIAGVIVAIEVVNDLADRDWARLGTVLVSSGFIALLAKREGLLSMYDRVPLIAMPQRNKAPAGGSAGRSKPAAAKKSDSGLGGRFGRRKEAEIVEMPQPAQRFNRPQRVEPVEDLSADDVLLDSLLDKISAGGIDSLTTDERRQLDEIRERRRHD